jgi:hypothetical protein
LFAEVEKQVGRWWHRLLLVGSVLLLGLSLAACSAAPTASGAGPAGGTATGSPTSSQAAKAVSSGKSAGAATQTSEGGQVTVAATWNGPVAGPVFDVALDTHSVDLDAIDLAGSALLRTDKGVEVKPLGWNAAKGGHHRSGPLTFPTAAPDGSPLIGSDTRVVELVIRGVAGVPERTMRRELSS